MHVACDSRSRSTHVAPWGPQSWPSRRGAVTSPPPVSVFSRSAPPWVSTFAAACGRLPARHVLGCLAAAPLPPPPPEASSAPPARHLPLLLALLQRLCSHPPSLLGTVSLSRPQQRVGTVAATCGRLRWRGCLRPRSSSGDPAHRACEARHSHRASSSTRRCDVVPPRRSAGVWDSREELTAEASAGPTATRRVFHAKGAAGSHHVAPSNLLLPGFLCVRFTPVLCWGS